MRRKGGPARLPGGRGLPVLAIAISMAPRDFPDDDDDGDHSQPDAHDDTDLRFDAGHPAGALDQLAAFLEELEDLYSMSGPDIMAAIADLPVPQEGFVDGMAFQDAVEVGKTHVMKSYYMISYMILLQTKLLPAHNMEDSRAFTRSERILLEHGLTFFLLPVCSYRGVW